MINITEEEYKALPKAKKRETPLTKLRQCEWSNPDNPVGVWITEGINFTILNKGGK